MRDSLVSWSTVAFVLLVLNASVVVVNSMGLFKNVRLAPVSDWLETNFVGKMEQSMNIPSTSNPLYTFGAWLTSAGQIFDLMTLLIAGFPILLERVFMLPPIVAWFLKLIVVFIMFIGFIEFISGRGVRT